MGPAWRLTCKAAVEFIMTRPAGGREVLFHGAVTRPRVDPQGRARRISPGVSQPETALGQGQPGAGALVPEPGDRRADSGVRRPGWLDLPAGLDGHRGARRDPPDRGRDRFDAFPGNGVGDVVEVDQM
jgi:hypothetical protein